MTYFVAWDLTVDPGPHHPGDIDSALDTAVDDAGGELLVSVSYGEHDAEPVSGYDPTEELENLSLRFPEALFTLTMTDCENYLPPEENGYGRVYVKAGRHQGAKARVVFESFDPARLVPS